MPGPNRSEARTMAARMSPALCAASRRAVIAARTRPLRPVAACASPSRKVPAVP